MKLLNWRMVANGTVGGGLCSSAARYVVCDDGAQSLGDSDCHRRGNPFSQDGLGCDTWAHAVGNPIRYNSKTGDKVTVAKAQKALASLRERQSSMIWKSARSEYAVDDAAMHRRYQQRIAANTWPPSGPQLDWIEE